MLYQEFKLASYSLHGEGGLQVVKTQETRDICCLKDS